MNGFLSFTFLVKNIPNWKETIDVLSIHAVKKNAEFAAAYARLVQQVHGSAKSPPIFPPPTSTMISGRQKPLEAPTTPHRLWNRLKLISLKLEASACVLGRGGRGSLVPRIAQVLRVPKHSGIYTQEWFAVPPAFKNNLGR